MKGLKGLVPITKEEKEVILERFPNTYFVRTMKQDSHRHRYYMTESPKQMRLLRSLRGEDKPRSKRGG